MGEKSWIETFETEIDRLRIHFIMANNKTLTDRNLDLLADFLTRELEQPNLAKQIPDGAQVFHGTYNDAALTQANLQRATKILVGMTLGFIEEAPLVMIFEYQPGQQTAIDLSSNEQKREIEMFIKAFQTQNQQRITGKISELVEV